MDLRDGSAWPGFRIERPRPGVALLWIDRPERLNALDAGMLLALPDLLEMVAADSSIRALVVSGAGPAFCAGGDLDVIASLRDGPPEQAEQILGHALRAPGILHRLPQVTIAAVNGPAAGGGLGLALACDLRVAAPRATFSAPFIHMALVPDFGVSWLLPRIIGAGAALDLLLSGRRLTADEAHALGLVSEMCDHPLASAIARAENFAAMPSEAAAATKRMVHRALEVDLETSVRAEVCHQAAALHGAEFAERFLPWHATITGAAAT